VRRGTECVGLVPLVLTRWHVGPLRLATLDLIGADPSLSEIRAPLIAPGYERPVVRAVHASLARGSDFDWIHWRGLSGELARELQGTATLPAHQVSQDFVLDLPSSWEELRTRLRRNLRESLRHCYNSLRRDGHEFTLEVARAPAEIGPALAHFLRLHALRAGMRAAPAHPDRFRGARLREFLEDVCQALARRDAVRIFMLRIQREIVAARVAFVVGDSLYLYYSGFDPAWARYSVMTTTVAEALRYAIAHGLRSANLSLHAERSKLRWRPRMVEYCAAVVPHDRLRSRLACQAYRAMLSGNRAPGRLLKSLLRLERDWG